MADALDDGGLAGGRGGGGGGSGGGGGDGHVIRLREAAQVPT